MNSRLINTMRALLFSFFVALLHAFPLRNIPSRFDVTGSRSAATSFDAVGGTIVMVPQATPPHFSRRAAVIAAGALGEINRGCFSIAAPRRRSVKVLTHIH